MITVRLPDNIENRLSVLAKSTERTKSFYVKQAILNCLEDFEDKYIAVSRLESDTILSAGEMERYIDDLDD
jgi:RHH-type rel operon transcriptional repressor/antitoxin RelB